MLTRFFLAILLCCAALAASAQPTLTPPGPQVFVNTNHGSFTIELYPTASPITVDNFLRYVRTRYYNGLIFHQVIPGLLIQGGGYNKKFRRRDTFEPIRNESDNGLSNLRGTVSMARLQDPHSATSEFFINLVDNKELDHSDEKFGSAVFGRVISGMDVVDKIAGQPRGKHRGRFKDAPNKTVMILEIRLVEEREAGETDSPLSNPLPR